MPMIPSNPTSPASHHRTTFRSPDQKRTSLGVLRGRVILTIQTYPAQRLIQGRRASEGVPAILGLIGFAERLKTLWQGAREEDPYAHWWLLKVDQALKQARAAIVETHARLQQSLEQGCALDVSIAASLNPERVELRFANPYAFLGAQMLAEFDRLICTQLTLAHIGLALTPALAQGIAAGERKIRSAFLAPQGYHFFGVDRAAIEQGAAPAQRAIERMGQVPEAVLSGALRAALAPHRARPAAPQTAKTSVPVTPVESGANHPCAQNRDPTAAPSAKTHSTHNDDSLCGD